MYHRKTIAETELQNRVDKADLSDNDYRDLFWRLWGACANNERTWATFECIVDDYLKIVKES